MDAEEEKKKEKKGEMGQADTLKTASRLIEAQLTPTEEFTEVTSAGRQIMRLKDVTVTQGSPADIVAMSATDFGSAMVGGTADRIVLRGGRIVARTLTATEIARPELHVMSSAWNLPRAPSAGDWLAARHPDR